MKFSSLVVSFFVFGDATIVVDSQHLKAENHHHHHHRNLKTGGGAVCAANLEWNEATAAVLSTIPNGAAILDGLVQYQRGGASIGATTALLPEASDAAVSGAPIQDGMSGDTDFPFGNLKPIGTVGETSVCQDKYLGYKWTGVPDGMGAYLADDQTVRVVVQSESYGPLDSSVDYSETYPSFYNDGGTSFTGSKIHYADYDRESLANFMSNARPASSFVTGFGEMVDYVYNLKGELIGHRNPNGPTETGVHYTNTDADGNWVVSGQNANGVWNRTVLPSEADWSYQSFCSAHLEQKHQWGEGIGLEDDIFLTDEEWYNYNNDMLFVGMPAQVLDIANRKLYAAGCFSNGGFEKIVELNPQHPDYVMFGVSGYNCDCQGVDTVLAARNAEYTDQTYVFTKYLHPYRIYVGVKGLLEDGSQAPEDDFLARNGLKYGQLYGYAIDMSESGPTGGLFRDPFHKSDAAHNGAFVPGKWIAQEWRWDGQVRNYQHDAGWDYQRPTGVEGYTWWNGNGMDAEGCKMEHVSPDVREGITGYVQGSTCGYFGHLYVEDVANVLSGADGDLPSMFDGKYYVYQGELDVTSQIELGGKGQYTNGRDATRNWDSIDGEGKVTFEDIDGLEVFMAADGNMYAMFQEDSGNKLGERMFITSALEHEDDGKELTYYFVAMSGGSNNTRMSSGVGVPAGTNTYGGGSHEFSGLFDLSGLLYKENGSFAMSASDDGAVKRAMDAMVGINDKLILVNVQSHNIRGGIVEHFGSDRGGQTLVYQPDIPI